MSNNNNNAPAAEEFNVWVSTFGLYNAGALLGYWTPASECPETVEEFRAGLDARGIDYARYIQPPWDEMGEELHCFDTENSPVVGEMSPMLARELAAILDTIPAHIPADVLAAWVDHGEDLDDSTAVQLEEYYAGTFESVEDYAGEMLEECGMLSRLPRWAQPYAGDLTRSMARDMVLSGEIWTARVAEGVAVFRSY